MANRRRGEVPLHLGPERYTLCLTLGALAELEDALGTGDLAGLAERFAAGRLRGRDLIALLGAALRGGGHDLDDAAVAALPLAGGFEGIARALGAALAAAFGEATADPEPHGRDGAGRWFPVKSPSAFPWDDALALGLGRLAWRPQDFWAATPRELMAAAGLARPRQTAGRADLARLLAAHPDTA